MSGKFWAGNFVWKMSISPPQQPGDSSGPTDTDRMENVLSTDQPSHREVYASKNSLNWFSLSLPLSCLPGIFLPSPPWSSQCQPHPDLWRLCYLWAFSCQLLLHHHDGRAKWLQLRKIHGVATHHPSANAPRHHEPHVSLLLSRSCRQGTLGDGTFFIGSMCTWGPIIGSLTDDAYDEIPSNMALQVAPPGDQISN